MFSSLLFCIRGNCMSHWPARTCLGPESGRQCTPRWNNAVFSTIKAIHAICILFVEQSVFNIYCTVHQSKQICLSNIRFYQLATSRSLVPLGMVRFGFVCSLVSPVFCLVLFGFVYSRVSPVFCLVLYTHECPPDPLDCRPQLQAVGRSCLPGAALLCV